MRFALIIVVAFAALAGVATASRSLFGYDRSLPLDPVLGTTTSTSGVVRQELSYAVTGSIRLKAYFVHPATGGPWPIVVWSPGYGGDRRQQLPDAAAAARVGVASLLVDEVFPKRSCDAGQDLHDFELNVVSRRRALDLAATLPAVDSKRIAAAGFSYGASVTAALSGVDHRPVAFILQSGRGHFSAYANAFCGTLGTAGVAAYQRHTGVVDAVHWVRTAMHAAFLLQNGTQDALSPRSDVLALYGAARGAKSLRWYPAGHALNAAATAERTRWLAIRLHATKGG